MAARQIFWIKWSVAQTVLWKLGCLEKNYKTGEKNWNIFMKNFENFVKKFWKI